MKATEINLLKFLKQPNQFVIPIYQRTYSWNEKQCQQLWQEVTRLAVIDLDDVMTLVQQSFDKHSDFGE